MQEPMTVGKLKELLSRFDDDVFINVFNLEGEYTANIAFDYELLDTRKVIWLNGLKPFYKIKEENK